MLNDDINAIIPTIETERLILRAHRLSDLDANGAMWSDERVTGQIGMPAQTASDVWQRLLRNRGHWATLGFGYWVMEERASGAFAGEVGFADFRRDFQPEIKAIVAGLPEGGWVLPVSAQGRGLASEAVAAMHDWGARTHGWRRAFCIIALDNVASLRVAEKAGYVAAAHGELREHPIAILMRDA